MRKIFLLLVLSVFASGVFSQSSNVKIKGNLVNFKSPVFLRSESPVKNLLGESIKIELDENNEFSIEFNLEKPGYFKLGRNTLYLEPGCNLKVYIDYKSSLSARFMGKGWEPNDYLKYKNSPKSGSFIDGGMLLFENPSLKEALEMFFNKYHEYEYKLNSYPNLSERFIEFERVRNNLYISNTLFYYIGYAVNYLDNKIKSREEYLEYEKEIKKKIDPVIRKYILKSKLRDEHLEIEELRGLSCYFGNYFKEKKIPVFIKEYSACYRLLSLLKGKGFNMEINNEKIRVEKLLTNKEYIAVIEKYFEKYKSLTPGNKAPVLKITDAEGNIQSIEKFKGKILVIDVWATWCGPCCAIAPVYHELAKEFKAKPVEFISLSVDNNFKKWMNHISKEADLSHHYRINNSEMKPYLLNGIPRFIVIDKNGNIIDAFAPRPGKGKLRKLIGDNL